VFFPRNDNPMSTTFAMTPPLLTADLPGLGGRIKVYPEDFEVEEIPAYQPSGSGDFLYLWLEKHDMGAEYFVRQIAKRLDIPTGEVGTAGLKDRHAVCRQMVSIPGYLEDRLPQLEGDGIRVLNVGRHGNKLRAGHLHGNRFRILVRDLEQAGLEHLDKLLQRLREHGLPNYYGSQRFGRDGETLAIGMAMLKKEHPILINGNRVNVRNPFLKKLALSAAQSGLFNYYLGRRLLDGLLRNVLPGDVMAKIPFGGMFVAEDVGTEQKRFDVRETVTAGPIFGRKTFPASLEAAQREGATLEVFGIRKEDFGGFGKLVQGTRRHNLVYLDDLATEREENGLRLTFTLPAGSYATVLLREIMKNDIVDKFSEEL
jgi:tRNA pseudouridine13 synthase